MNALLKIATITNLVAEIGDCDEIQFTLDGFVKVLTDLKTALAEPPKKVVMKYQLDADGNRVGDGVPVPNTFETHSPHVKRSSLNLEDGKWVEEAEEMVRNDFDAPESDDEEEDDLEPCKCNTRMDIRGRCDPVRSAKQFSKCPARFDTTYFHIQNECDKYNAIQGCRNRGEKQEKVYQFCREEPFFLTDDKLEDEILYLIEQDEENEEENCCCRCDGFIPYADEDSAKWCDSEDRWVCYSCEEDCFCAECDEYFPDEDELEYLNKDNEDCKKYCCDCYADKKCECLEEEVKGYIEEMDNGKDKLDMLEEIKNLIAKYKK